jgi:hypothetical protein
MCTEKLQLEVGKTYVNGEGCPVILVYKGWGSRPFLGVVDASTDNERTAWYKEDGESTYGGKMSLVREKRPTKTFRYKRFLWKDHMDEPVLAMYRENGRWRVDRDDFIKWIDEEWQTIEVEV